MCRIGGKLRRLARWVLVSVAVVSVAAACSGGQVSPASDPTPTGLPEPTLSPPPPLSVENVFTITIEDSEYSPLSVPTGTEVSVVNRDNVEHTITSDRAGLFDVHVQPLSTETFTAPEDLGLYPYHCTYHPAMRGQLIVE
jgi:plastocyanin